MEVLKVIFLFAISNKLEGMSFFDFWNNTLLWQSVIPKVLLIAKGSVQLILLN